MEALSRNVSYLSLEGNAHRHTQSSISWDVEVGMATTNICVVRSCMDLVSASELGQRQLCVEDLALLSNESCWELEP